MWYVHDHPLVLVAAILAVLTAMAMTVTSTISYRFLRALQSEAEPFWTEHFRNASIALLRIARVTPIAVERAATDDEARRISARFARSFRLWRNISFGMLALTVVALLLVGWRG